MSSESENKSIIALKGHPFTRKTELAKHIAESFSCPVLPLDHFLDFFQSPSPSTTFTSSSAPSPKPQDLAFGVICQIANSNLSSGVVKQIVIDSPLSSRSHLDQLIELASSLEQTRLVIVECKTDNTYKWQTCFEEYRSRNPDQDKTRKWYKVKDWEDVEKALKGGFDERSHGYIVPKLVVDPVYDYISHNSHSPFKDAVEYMIARKEGDGPDVVVYRRWLQGEYERFCRAGSGHYITNYADGGLEYEAKCSLCGNRIMGAAYTCEHCSFALHKECAELLGDNKQQSDSSSGGDCLLTSYLKSRQMPAVIRHGCNRHFLSVVLAELSPYEELFPCKACGDAVESVWYSCKVCSVAYHYECLTRVPARKKHVHGDHHHHMVLHYSSKEAEDYICDVCFEEGDPDRRDPWLWFYSCEKCPYVAHLHCVE